MDPIIVQSHDQEGFVVVNELVKLHYQLYLPPSASQHHRPKVLMIMGAFATAVHFANEARVIANKGYEVCIYDHRGVAKSGPARKEQQTAELLAADALVLIDTIWGSNAAVHVYGASMGGMVAQELAVLLLPQHRLMSLGLAVTCRGLKPLGGLLTPIVKPQILKIILQAWYWDSRPALVRRLMRLVLSRNLLDMMHPSGETYEAVYYREWLANYEDYWTLKDHTTGACHACVCLSHYLSDSKVETLRDCGVPILCQVSTRDHLIPPAMQFDLAKKLKARTVTFPTGHMGVMPWKDQFHNMLLEQFAMGEALRGIQIAEAARALRKLQLPLLPSLSAGSSSIAVALLPASSCDSLDSSSSSSSSRSVGSDNVSVGVDSCTSSCELMPCIADSTADLAVKLACWSDSSSSSSGSCPCKDTTKQQQQQQQCMEVEN